MTPLESLAPAAPVEAWAESRAARIAVSAGLGAGSGTVALIALVAAAVEAGWSVADSAALVAAGAGAVAVAGLVSAIRPGWLRAVGGTAAEATGGALLALVVARAALLVALVVLWVFGVRPAAAVLLPFALLALLGRLIDDAAMRALPTPVGRVGLLRRRLARAVRFARVAGAVLAAIALAAGGSTPALLVAAALALAALGVLARPWRVRIAPGARPLVETARIRDGLWFVVRHRVLSRTATALVVHAIFVGMSAALLPTLLVHTLGLGTPVLAIVVAAAASGSLAGSWLASRYRRTVLHPPGLANALAAAGVIGLCIPAAAALQAAPIAGFLGVAVGVAGVSGALAVVTLAQSAQRARLVPGVVGNAAGAAVRGGVALAGAAGAAVGGLLGAWLGVQAALWIAATGALVATVFVTVTPLSAQFARSGAIRSDA